MPVQHIDFTNPASKPFLVHRPRLQLLDAGATVRAAVRTSGKAATLTSRGAEEVAFDYTKPSGWATAFAGADGLFLVLPFNEGFAATGEAIVAAAKESGIKHITKLSALGVPSPGADPSPLALGIEHQKSDAAVASSGLSYTLIKPNFFMSNFLGMQGASISAKGEFYGASAGAKMSYVAPADVAAVAVTTLLKPSEYNGKEFNVTGPTALTDAEVATLLSERLGKTVSYIDLPNEKYAEANLAAGVPAWVVQSVAGLEGVKAAGYAEQVSSAVQDLVGRPAIAFVDFLSTSPDPPAVSAPAAEPAEDGEDDITAEQRERLETSSKIDTLIKEGELTKQGGSWHTWKKRWFRLTSSAVSYCDKKDTNKIKGGCLLETVTSVRVASSAESKKPHSFVIDTNTGRTYVIHANSNDERDEWISAISTAVSEYMSPGDAETKPKAASNPSAGGDAGVDAAKTGTIKLFYWPLFARAGALLRMLDEAKAPYQLLSEFSDISTVASAFGAQGTTFAPPIIVDGDVTISQSVATAVYIGRKFGFCPSMDQEPKALQAMLDIVDLFDNGLAKNADAGDKLHVFLEGSGKGPSRFALLASNIERQISGPFFFGKSLTYVDFHLASFLENYEVWGFQKLSTATSGDYFAPYPKMVAIAAAIQALPSAKDYSEHKANLAAKHSLKEDVLADFVQEYMKGRDAASSN